MRKAKWFYGIILFILLFSGCRNSAVDTVGKIISPQNKLMPIEGIWEIERGYNNDFSEMPQDIKDKWVGKTVQFSDNAVAVGLELFRSPQYKIKKVNTEEYLLYRHKQPAEKYGLTSDEVYIVTIAAKELYSFDAIITDRSKLIIEFEDYIFYLTKLSDKVDNFQIGNFIGDNGDSNSNMQIDESQTRTGLVLGLKYPGKNSRGEVEYKYRTLWIGIEDRKLRPVMETKGMFFPRHDGFWRIEPKRLSLENRSEDIFYAYSVINGSKEELNNITIDTEKWGDRTGSIIRSISYICNNYIGIESIGEGEYINSSKWNENRLQLQLVDNLPSLRNIKLYDIAGEAGIKAINNGKQEALGLINEGKIILSEDTPQDENFGLFRKAGHWLFKGRLDYKTEEEVFKFADFNINIIPPLELVFYDDLWVPWTQIKDKVPEAIDAYTSPNKDIAIIVTKNRILIYEIYMGSLGEAPLKRINLKSDETVIMAEWANGNYMDNWEKSFMKNEVREIK